MEIYFVNKGIYNYLEVNLGEDRNLLDKGNYYKIKMVEDNEIPNILTPVSLEIDGRTYLRCNTTSYYVLDRMFLKLKPDGEFLRLMIMQLLKCMEELENYLLSPEDLVINPEYMFYDLNEKRLKLLYVPGYNASIRKQIKQFLEYIMKIFDHRDRQGMTLLYEVYNYFVKEELDLDKLKLRLQNSPEIHDREIHYNNLYLEKQDDTIEEYNTEALNNLSKSKIGLLVLGIIAIVAIGFVLKYLLLGKKIYDLYLSIGFFIGAVIVAAFFSFREEEDVDEIMKEYADWSTPSSNKVNEQVVEGEEVCLVEEHIHSLIPLTNGSLEAINLERNNTIVVGRDKKDTDYRLPTTQISRIHACIYKREDGIYVEDRDSTNGTFINYNRLVGLTPYRIKKGDVISFANEEFFVS